MARMHARKKGKSGSTHPPIKTHPKWVQYNKDEVVDLIVQLAKEGKNLSQIGLILRDQHGIPSVKAIVGKSVSQILKEKKITSKWPDDLMNLIKKAVKLRKHLEGNKMDFHNKRALQLTESKIRRLVAYYKKTGIVAKDWYYKPMEAALLIKE